MSVSSLALVYENQLSSVLYFWIYHKLIKMSQSIDKDNYVSVHVDAGSGVTNHSDLCGMLFEGHVQGVV